MENNINRMPLIGDIAPSFKAVTTQGNISFPEDYKGKWVILFSHPADFTPVCTTEFMTFASMAEEFKAMNTELVGLSVDSLYAWPPPPTGGPATTSSSPPRAAAAPPRSVWRARTTTSTASTGSCASAGRKSEQNPALSGGRGLFYSFVSSLPWRSRPPPCPRVSKSSRIKLAW